MEQISLSQFLKDACSYFERRLPADVTYNLWFEDLKNIPAESLPFIRNRLKELDAWPKNFPRFIWGIYREWLEVNPHKKAPEEKPGCLQCHEGFILVSSYDAKAHFPGW